MRPQNFLIKQRVGIILHWLLQIKKGSILLSKNGSCRQIPSQFLKDAKYGTKDLANYQKYLEDISKSTFTFINLTQKAGTVFK